MGYFYKWSPSKKAKREFAQKMNEIEDFCDRNGISASSSKDSYYFTLNGVNYRVSNHSVELSNNRMFNDYGEKIRDSYHPNGREKDTVYIHASKTRIIDIYTDLKNNIKLDGRGFRK